MQINRSELGCAPPSRHPVVPNHLPHVSVKTPLVFGTPVSDSPLAPPLVLLTDPRGCAKSPLVRAPTARAPLVTSGIEQLRLLPQ